MILTFELQVMAFLQSSTSWEIIFLAFGSKHILASKFFGAYIIYALYTCYHILTQFDLVWPVELYRRFLQQYPNLKISLRRLKMMRPLIVRKLKDRYTCCCIKHVQMLYFKYAFNKMRQCKSGLHLSCNYRCGICVPSPCISHCVASNASYSSVSDIWESFLCKKAKSSMFHDFSCY